jgi:hypothetical protein
MRLFKQRYISFGDYHVGPFCGERIFSLRDWRRRGFKARRHGSGFYFGPIFFWKEKI